MFNNGNPSSRVIQVIETRFSRGFGIDKDICRTVVRYFDMDGDLLAERDDCPSDPSFNADAYIRQAEHDKGFVEHMAHELAASKAWHDYREQYPTLDAEAQAKMDKYMDELVEARTAQLQKLFGDFKEAVEENKREDG